MVMRVVIVMRVVMVMVTRVVIVMRLVIAMRVVMDMRVALQPTYVQSLSGVESECQHDVHVAMIMTPGRIHL